ncbi:tetratricopeptide repeat protein [bacterium]|nr:tetratricopeptide repeat protein [bacterium]
MVKKFLTALIIGLTLSSAVFAEDVEISSDAKLIYNEGVNLYKLGEYDRAMEAFKKATIVDPNYIDAYFNLGYILEQAGRYPEALTVFKQIIVRDPADYESVYKAASLSMKLGEIDKAKSYLSIIPPTATIAPKAQELAHMLQTDMQTIKAEEVMKTAEERKVALSNNIFNDIPSPTGITTDKDGNVYVAAFSENTVYQITPDGKRVVFLKDARINGPIGIVSDDAGNMYVANYNNDNVVKISSLGEISVLIGNVLKPYNLHIDEGILYISSQGSNSVIKYVLK